MDSRYVGISSPSNFLPVDGTGSEPHFTAGSNVLWELIVMGLDFTYFSCVVGPLHLQAGANSLPRLASAVHKFPAPEGNVKKCQCNTFILSSLAQLFFLIRAEQQKAAQPSTFLENHTRLRRTDGGMSSGGSLFLWLMLRARVLGTNKILNELEWNWLKCFFKDEAFFFSPRMNILLFQAASKGLWSFTRLGKMDSSGTEDGEKIPKKMLIWGALRVFNILCYHLDFAIRDILFLLPN